jgi:hypothetical protein
MATKIERAYCALHELLDAMAQGLDAVPGKVMRNTVLAETLAESRTGVRGLLNLVDQRSIVDAELICGDADDQEVELIQPARLEVVVIEADPVKREAQFDQIMEALGQLFVSMDGTLGGVVDEVRVSQAPERFVLNGYQGAKAAAITIEMLLTAPTVFG